MILTQGLDYTVSAAGRYTFAAAQVGKKVTIQYQSNTPAQSALQQIGLGMATGSLGQPVWGYLQSNYPAQAIGYSGISYVYAPAYDLGSDAQVANHSFEVQTWSALPYSNGDANPATCALDLLTNARYGANFPTSRVDQTSLGNWSAYAAAANLLMSPALTQQKPAAEWLQYLLQLSNTDVVWSQGLLKFVPLGDAAVSAWGVSFTPNVTPQYDLTEDHFITEDEGADPLVVERRANDDVFNHVRIEYTNRANQYNTEVLEVKDAADIDRRGLRTKETLEAHAICETSVAAGLAQLLLQRELAVRNVYKFRLPWTFALLEPLDIVTVSDPYLGLSRVPVRINKIAETEGGDFDVEAEDCPIGMASAPAYGRAAGAGFAHDYNVAPGSVAAPFFFEPPVQLTTTGLEVWAAVSGLQAAWGGCSVWCSTDGNSYRQVGRIYGGVRYGALSGDLAAAGTSLGVALAGLGGTIQSGSASDAAALQSLLFVGDGNGGEYLTYQGATLTGSNAYTLATLGRGVYYSAAQARKANQATVVRVDGAIAKSGPLLPAQVGQKLYFKFTSFNIYGGAEQGLADVPAYAYTPSGYMLRLPPPAPASFTFDGAKTFTWPAADYPRSLLAGYEIRFQYGTNQSYADAVPLQADVISDNPYIAAVVPQGSVTFMLRTVDKFGNRSLSGPLVVTQLGDPVTSNVVQSNDFKAAGWPGTITGSAGVSGGNIVASNGASALGSAQQPAFSANGTDPAFQSTYAGISYSASRFSPAQAGKLTLLHTVDATQYQVNYRASNPAPAFGATSTSAMFGSSGTAAAFPAVPGWQAWPGAIQATVQPYEFQLVCGVGTRQQTISRLTAQVDVPDVNLRLAGVAISAAGTRLAAAVGKFVSITNVNLTLQGGGTAVSAQFLDRSSVLGPLVICLNAAGAQVAGTVDALLQGY